ncbi:MAG: gliding motility protein GldL [Flavobacteriaceae bacterium]|nr:gliding motility protein GldL [Flavobacteriaceae bacterium]
MKRKKIFNMIYGIGAAIVIVGALAKLQHWPYGGILLTVGMVVEAFVFFVSAFEPVEEDIDWSRLYPELNDKKSDSLATTDEAQSMLSQKLDDMLREARLDANLIQNLTNNLQNFKGATENIQPMIDSIASSNKYSQQISMAATQLETLNSAYKTQMEESLKQAKLNQEVSENVLRLNQQMQSLTANLASLNTVYGGMLSAMSKK